MRILITGVGGPTPRSFAVALQKYSFYKRFELYGTDINPLAIGLYQNGLFSKTFIIPAATSTDYWTEIEKIVEENNIEVAVILPELEVLEWSKRKKDHLLPCKALLPAFSVAQLLVDKWKMTEVLKDLDIVPPSISFSRDTVDFSNVFDKLGSEFWVRSTSGTSGLGSLKVENEESLMNWININPRVDFFIASKFLSGRNLACKMLYFNGRLVRVACAERVSYIMSKVAPSGITGNTSFGRLINEPKLIEEAKRAMDFIFNYLDTQRHGFFTIDFKEDENAQGIHY